MRAEFDLYGQELGICTKYSKYVYMQRIMCTLIVKHRYIISDLIPYNNITIV